MVLPQNVKFCEKFKFVFCNKIIDDSNFVPYRLLLLHPARAVTSSRQDFKAQAELIDHIYKIKNFCIEALTW